MTFLPRLTAALAAAALLPIAAAAQQPAPQGPPPQGRGGARAAQVNRPIPNQLTDAQREQIRTFDEQHRQALEAARNELGDLHRQLNEQLTAAQPDNAKITSLRSAIVQKETALAQARLDRLAKMSSILTAEQRQSLRGRGLGEIFGPGGGGRGGAMAGPRGGGAGRGGAVMQRRQQFERQLQMRRGLRGRGGAMGMPRGGRGGAMAVPRGGRGGGVQRERADDARLRAEIRRLEAQLEALRRRIR